MTNLRNSLIWPYFAENGLSLIWSHHCIKKSDCGYFDEKPINEPEDILWPKTEACSPKSTISKVRDAQTNQSLVCFQPFCKNFKKNSKWPFSVDFELLTWTLASIKIKCLLARLSTFTRTKTQWVLTCITSKDQRPAILEWPKTWLFSKLPNKSLEILLSVYSIDLIYFIKLDNIEKLFSRG